MDILTLCICCLVGGLVIFIIALVLGQKRMRQVESVMRELAERHGGHFTPGNLLYNPCVTFQEGGRRLRLYAALGGRDDPSHTELRVELPETPGAGVTKGSEPSLNVRLHSFKTRLTVTLGAKPYLTGDMAFDEAFDARGAPEALLRRCLNPEVRQSLLALKAYRPAARIGRVRGWLPGKKDKNAGTEFPAPKPVFERVLHPSLQFIFYTAGLPVDLESWEPRLEAARLMLGQVGGGM
jgi:hypothetical protein